MLMDEFNLPRQPWGVIPILAIAVAVFGVALYLTVAAVSGRILADADRTFTARAQCRADSLDRTLQWRMTEVFTFAAPPSLRGSAAEAARPVCAAVAQGKLRAIAAPDPNVRAASLPDTAGGVIRTTDLWLRVSHTVSTFHLVPSMIQHYSYSDLMLILYSSYSDPTLILYTSIAPSIPSSYPPAFPLWTRRP